MISDIDADLTPQIKACVSRVTGQPFDDNTLPKLDSLGVVELISELELTFDCPLDMTDITHLQTVDGIAQLIQQSV